MLQQSLEGLLLEGLQTSSVDIVRHCLRTYATIDKTRDAEALVGQVLVKPYIDEVCALCSCSDCTLLGWEVHLRPFWEVLVTAGPAARTGVLWAQSACL